MRSPTGPTVVALLLMLTGGSRAATPAERRTPPRMAPASAATDTALPPWVAREASHGKSDGPSPGPEPSSAAALTSGPSGRFAHSAIYDPVRNRMVVFGGRLSLSTVSTDEVLSLPLGGPPDWQTVVTAGASPGVRSSHSAIYDPVRDRMIVFGGYDGSRLNTVYTLSLSGFPTWSLMSVTGTPPSPRNLHSAIYDPVRDRMIVFGGYENSAFLNDVWALNLSGTPSWSKLTPAGPLPTARREHTAIYDPLRDRMIVFGGLSDGGIRNDAWALSLGASPAWSALPGFPASARFAHTAIYDAARDRMVVFGGQDGSYRWDTWELRLSPAAVWGTLSPSGTVPLGRESATMVAAGTARAVMFGGLGSTLFGDTWDLGLSAPESWAPVTTTGPSTHVPPLPAFNAGVGPLPGTILLGQSFSVTLSVRNDGGRSDDGRISLSIPSFTHPDDGQWVSGTSAGDAPGYVELPAGSTLQGHDCTPVTASYLAVEYVDTDWIAAPPETNNPTITIQPQAVGDFTFYVRSTMHDPEGAGCSYLNALPPDGIGGTTDQQGWAVQRFTVRVIDRPDPVFTTPIAVNRPNVVIGESFTMTASVRNEGTVSDDGRIVFSFPGLTDPLDAARVSSTSAGDSPGFQVRPTGAGLSNAACQPMTATSLVAEYVDDDWQALGTETNAFSVTVRPPAVGTFYVYVRSTMREAGAGGCVLFNGVPNGGESGFVDQQGFPVTRYAVTVEPIPPPPVPVFSNFTIGATSGTPGVLTLGQAIPISFNVANTGGRSDDGRVVCSFPLPCTVLPGTLPAGSTLLDAGCQPVITTYPVSEILDSDWEGGGAEVNSFQYYITPTAVGTFYFDVRATMHAYASGCEFVNGLPASGTETAVDEQGWPVRRFTFTVRPNTPVPVVPSPAAGIPGTVPFGQPFTFTVSARNDGTHSTDGRIVVGFPRLTDPVDVDQVSGAGGGDAPGYREIRAGETENDASCATVTVPYAMVEYADQFWGGFDEGSPEFNETNSLALTVQPRSVGDFLIEVRSTMLGASGCVWHNGVPPDGEAGTDPLGWTVKRYHVLVTPPADLPAPDPTFTEPVALSATAIGLGDWFTITASVRNDGADSDEGAIAFSFPTLTDVAEIEPATGGSSGDHPGYVEWGAGAEIVGSSCQTLTATYPTAAYVDDAWGGLLYGQEKHTLSVKVRPRAAGTVYIDVRTTLRRTGAVCEYVNEVPASGDPAPPDQFGWTVRRYAVTVAPAPPGTTGPQPRFTVTPTGFPGSITLGQTFTFNAAVTNDGLGSDDGRIHIAFPYFTRPDDAQWVSCASTGDPPGYREFPVGSALTTRDCQSTPASCLVAEYGDDTWNGNGQETNAITVTVQPREVGVFAFEVRSTMHRASWAPCDEVNGLPLGGYSGYVDQQGWPVQRFEVVVNAPATPPNPPTTAWSPITPTGPGPEARSAPTSVYDAGRDALVTYGGFSGHYFNDIWSLPLSPGATWSTIVPGGPVPLRRSLHSMIYNPVEDHLVIFGGIYDDYMNDLWLIARNPVAWWFPITVAGAKPSPRFGHAAVYDPVRHRMIVIGGFDGALKNDVWEYSPMVNGTWQLLQPAGGPIPARADFSAVYDAVRDRILVFGGDGGSFLNDVWELRLGGPLTWNLLAPDGPPPSRRREHTAIYHSRWDQMIVFGGFDGARRNDVWALSLAGPGRWERLYASTASPSPRSLQSAAYDPVRNRMLVFGGQTAANSYSSEVWALSIDQPTATVMSLSRVEANPGRVRIVWAGTGAASLAATVERRTVESEWAALGRPDADGADALAFEDRAVTPGLRYAYRLLVREGGSETATDAVWVTVPARAELALAGTSPNPARGTLAVTFTLPGEGDASLALYDLRGRLVARRDVGDLGAGEHRVTLADTRRLAAGVYLVRLTRGDRSLTAKTCVMR